MTTEDSQITEKIHASEGIGCFSGDTPVFTPVRQFVPIREAYDSNAIITIWSYDFEKEDLVFKRAEVYTRGLKTLRCVEVNERKIWVTADHHFYTSEHGFMPNGDIDSTTFLKGIKCEEDEDEDFLSDHKLMTQCRREGASTEEAFSIKVFEGNNCVIVTEFDHHHYSGIIVKG